MICVVSAGGASAGLGGAAASRGPELWLVTGACAIAVFLCLPAINLMSFLWSGSEFYGHGFAMPLVAGYLVYQNRVQFFAALRDLRPPPLGALVAFSVGALEVLMVIGDVGFAASVGIPGVLAAAAYAIGGMPLLRPLTLPLGFLAMMVPLPRFLTYQILFRLKLAVTDTAVSLLQAGGKTVAAEGNRILLPDHTLYVADACSGLTSIVTLLPLSCIVAYFLSRGVWRRAVVIASVIPLAMAANTLRVLITVQLVSTLGPEHAQGLLHESYGVATSILGTLAVIGVARVLR